MAGRRVLIMAAAAAVALAVTTVVTLQTAGTADAAVSANGLRVAGSANPTAAEARITSKANRTVAVDIEIYDVANHRVFQKVWNTGHLTAGRPTSFRTSWTPPVPGVRTYRVAVGVFTSDWSRLLAWNNTAAKVVTGTAPPPTASPTPTPSPTATHTPTPAPPSSTPTPDPPPGSAHGHFSPLALGATLPSGAQCATWVRSVPTPAEVKGVNAAPNATPGKPIAGATGVDARVDGAFTGTTEQILRWAACKWGADEDMVKAQAVVESWWRMDTKGDLGTDSTRCAPGHGIGVDGTTGECPESFGLLQVRYPYNQSAFPYAATSSAFNADYAYAQWRNCYDGNLTWLNTVDRVGTYGAGDAKGCLGVWFSGRWHTSAADGYITKVEDTLDQRTWTTANFRQP